MFNSRNHFVKSNHPWWLVLWLLWLMLSANRPPKTTEIHHKMNQFRWWYFTQLQFRGVQWLWYRWAHFLLMCPLLQHACASFVKMLTQLLMDIVWIAFTWKFSKFYKLVTFWKLWTLSWLPLLKTSKIMEVGHILKNMDIVWIV